MKSGNSCKEQLNGRQACFKYSLSSALPVLKDSAERSPRQAEEPRQAENMIKNLFVERKALCLPPRFLDKGVKGRIKYIKPVRSSLILESLCTHTKRLFLIVSSLGPISTRLMSRSMFLVITTTSTQPSNEDADLERELVA